MKLPSASLAPLLLSFFCADKAAQSVHVVDVDNGPGTDFASIGAAIGAAAEGDLLLVREGSYLEAVVIDGKSLSVQAETGARVVVDELSVRNLGAAQFVGIRGLEVRGALLFGLAFEDNRGSIWVEDVALPPPFSPFIDSGIVIARSDCVVLRNVRVDPLLLTLGPSIAIEASTAHFYASCVEATSGVPSPFTTTSGGTAVVATDSVLTVQGSTILGGDGSPGPPLNCDGGEGGYGIVAVGASEVWLLDCDVQGGLGGDPGPGCQPGDPGSPVSLIGATLVQLPGAAPSFKAPSPLRFGQEATLTFEGAPGGEVFLIWSTDTGPARGPQVPLFAGTTQLHVVSVGTLPATGVLTRAVRAPVLATGEVFSFYAQALFLSSVASASGAVQVHVVAPAM